jgi:hypothetical protein
MTMNKSPPSFAAAMPFGSAMRRYVIELILAMIGYAAVLITSLSLVRTMQQGWLRVLVAIAPAIPIAFVLVVVIRFVSRLDEMWRRIWLEAVALAGGTTVLLAVTCAFLENVGLPRLSGFWTFGAFLWLGSIFAVILGRRLR